MTVAPTEENYFKAFLQGLGLPVTQANLMALYSVAQLEGPSNRYNPLNVVQPEPGSTDYNSVGVQTYADFDSGVKGAVTLFSGSHWDGVRQALAQGNSTQSVLDAFKSAYTWDPNVSFPTPDASWAHTSVGTGGGSGNPITGDGSGGGGGNGGLSLTASQYKAALGDLSGLLQAVPELHDILKQALAQGWSAGKFQQQVQQSNWWQTHNDQARQLVALQFQDPAQYKTQVANAKSQVQNLADQMGVQLNADQINHLANRYLIEGWDSTTLQGKVGSRYTGTGPAQGEAASFQQQLQQIYGDMGLPISDQAITNRTRQLLSGQTTIDTYQEAAKQAAMSLYPSLAKQLNDGMTVKDIADPYIQDMANTLELDPNSINLTNPLVKKALQGTTITGDNGKSSFTSTPMWQFEQQLRSDPRWQYTQNARDTMATSLMQVGRDMGFEA